MAHCGSLYCVWGEKKSRKELCTNLISLHIYLRPIYRDKLFSFVFQCSVPSINGQSSQSASVWASRRVPAKDCWGIFRSIAKRMAASCLSTQRHTLRHTHHSDTHTQRYTQTHKKIHISSINSCLNQCFCHHLIQNFAFSLNALEGDVLWIVVGFLLWIKVPPASLLI